MPIVLFDGDCGLCNASVSFIIDRDRNLAFQFAAPVGGWPQTFAETSTRFAKPGYAGFDRWRAGLYSLYRRRNDLPIFILALVDAAGNFNCATSIA